MSKKEIKDQVSVDGMVVDDESEEKFLERKDISILLGKEAFKEVLSGAVKDDNPLTKTSLLDDVDIVFEYLFEDVETPHPTIPGITVMLEKDDRDYFKIGWEQEQDKYFEELERLDKQSKKLNSNKDTKLLYPPLGLFDKQFEDLMDRYEEEKSKKNNYRRSSRKSNEYRYKKYVAPKFIYDRFDKLEDSTKKIIFPKEQSDLFWKVFQSASGKEIMFYGELVQSEEDPNTYNVIGINFPPQLNYGGYVETADGDYEKWMFEEIILKGKRVPLHVHTHPDFSAFSSSVDERQIKQYIKDNGGNDFVVQLIVSNPIKGTYFIRWFDLKNNTWEQPKVEFTYDRYDIEDKYPGIFQFDPPPRYTRSTSSRLRDFDKDFDFDKDYDEWKYGKDKPWYSGFKWVNPDVGRTQFEDDYTEDENNPDNYDLSDPDEFDKYFQKNFKKMIKIK